MEIIKSETIEMDRLHCNILQCFEDYMYGIN